MKTDITTFPKDMEELRKFVDQEGKQIEFWSARDLQSKFGYDKWDNFALVIEKAKENCSRVGEDPKNHFAEVRKMVSIGSGAYREQIDVVLSRTACYLIALNGEASKLEISWAKAYFVVQTKLQEKRGELIATEERLRLREKLKEANRQLGGAAKTAGVQNFAYFHDAGIRGLYGMKMSELKSIKGVSQKDDYWDNVSALELSANEFKAQLAKKTIDQKRIRGQRPAEQEHERVGKTVRSTIFAETGIHLEKLPKEPSLKKLVSAQKKAKKIKQPQPPLLPDGAGSMPPIV